MEDLALFRRQFLLTSNNNLEMPWKKFDILNYHLFCHPDLEYEYSKNENIEIHLLGFLFDYDFPELTNKQILNSLSQTRNLDQFINRLSRYSGHYAIIYKSKNEIFLMNDACAQYEIYYDSEFSAFGSQPKLLTKVVNIIPHSEKYAAAFYSSEVFLSSKLFIGETTHSANIKHLLPNHYIDIIGAKVIRYFPNKMIDTIPTKVAAKTAIKMLKGYLKAASLRYNLIMGVTGGYDSRVLFLSSINIPCKYYVTQLPDMPENHDDILIPKKLTKLFNKNLKIIPSNVTSNPDTDYIQQSSIDYPRILDLSESDFKEHVLINGNISEIARNRYGYYKNISSEDLVFIVGYGDNKFVIKEYAKWISNNSNNFRKFGYNILDMFYWEDRMAIWAAKTKTEMSARGFIVYSPFCSNELLVTLLSTPRKKRDFIYNKLYFEIFKALSPQAAKIPVNPSWQNMVKRIFNIFKLYNLYRMLGLKYRFMSPIQKP